MAGDKKEIVVVGGGLAGSECALQLSRMGWSVRLFEMRQSGLKTPAHQTEYLGELVCSNSLGSFVESTAPGQLKWEAQQLGSELLKLAIQCQVPAGGALTVDRQLFAELITEAIKRDSSIEIIPERASQLSDLPRPCVIATGPLTHEGLTEELQGHFGEDALSFYDAIAPFVETSSLDFDKVLEADRYSDEPGNYLNCPLTEEEYLNLIRELNAAKKVPLKDFEEVKYFEGCLPIEVLSERGEMTLAFGPLKPVGLTDPRTGRRPFAVVQLRPENREKSAYSLVGFQTKMTYGEQKRVLRLIPGLESAEFLRLGSIHRNLFINSTIHLNRDLSSKKDPNLFFAGQITGVEGYFESISTGLICAHFINQKMSGKEVIVPPKDSALGALLAAITEDPRRDFQPTNINFGLLPPPTEKIRKKRERRLKQVERARASLLEFRKNIS
jgi:methylenetetrahydrofolate--tRNA-(uracil-5-)-methyltransferase